MSVQALWLSRYECYGQNASQNAQTPGICQGLLGYSLPPQDGAGSDQPVHPQPHWQEADQRGEDRTVGPVEPGPQMGAAQHGGLVPQHEQFGVLGGCRPAKQDQPAAEPDEDEVEQAQGHGP